MAAEKQIITLLTDFGTSDSYVAQMKGVILSRSRDVVLVDITHEVPAQDILTAAMILADACSSFPPGTIHVIVVDPGVGSERRILCLSAARQLFLAPDNGVLELIYRQHKTGALVEVTSEWYFSEGISNTFHGRDIFASVAGHLATGVRPSRLGPKVTDPVRIEVPQVALSDNQVEGAVVYIDRFGNLVTNIERAHLAQVFQGVKSSQFLLTIGSVQIKGLSRTYAEAPAGGPMCLLGSSGRLEISVPGGSAQASLHASRGDPVVVHRL